MISIFVFQLVDSQKIITIGNGFSGPCGIYGDNTGNIFVADYGNHQVKKIAVDGTISVVGSGFRYPTGVFVDSVGTVYVADFGNYAVKRIAVNGDITSIGSGFKGPTSVFVDGFGNVFVADYGDYTLKKVNTNGVISIINGDFSQPYAVFGDTVGNLFLIDSNNMVKKFDVNGRTSTIGNRFNSPCSVFVDSIGNIFVADRNNRLVKKKDPNGVISTIGYGFSFPASVFVDSVGNVFVADNGNNDVKKIITTDTITSKIIVSSLSVSINATSIASMNVLSLSFSSLLLSIIIPFAVFILFIGCYLLLRSKKYTSKKKQSFGNQNIKNTTTTSRIKNTFIDQTVSSNSSQVVKDLTRVVDTTKHHTTLYSNNTTIAENTKQLSLPGHLRIENDISYRLGSKLGAGGMGAIYNCDALNNDLKKRIGNQKIVAKVMTAGSNAGFFQEVAIMTLFINHENFAQLVGYQDETKVVLMILYSMGSFDSYIRKTPNRSLISTVQIIIGTFKALVDLHSCGIVHNDIKPANILLSKSGDDFIPKLTDFGVSNVIESRVLHVKAFEVHNVRGLSISYAAPERLTKVKFLKNIVAVAKSADTYSMAIVIVESLTGQHPWN